jgi:conjugative relaxase-like TrwC/TraI family protein
VAWMRMMGADSVAYHEATVMGRADDFPGRALAYYASRGETPLVWGGAGAERLGLAGRVTEAQYRAIYGPGGACDPTTGERLVSTLRPGMELVISAHKSVAELGVIGRAEDMHRIMDAERDATLAYLEAMTQARGGRRGRQRTPTATSGLVYAHTRHATSRAGDPSPHDHVLLANLVEMLDAEGGWKAADTTLWREHLHAATIVGRAAAARTAVELGYAIAPDHGPSGRLGHWRIVGIPDEVLEIHSKRAAEISETVEARGESSYRARNIAARDTRAVKRYTPVGELMPRWHNELAAVGWTVPELVASVERAGREAVPEPGLSDREITRLMAEAFAPDGRLSVAKVFTAADVVVTVGPALYGRPVEDLERVVRRVLAVPDCVPLLGVRGAREPTYATAAALATEAAVAELVGRGTGMTAAATVPARLVEMTIARAEDVLGHPLTSGQAKAVRDICQEGRRISLVLGVAGAGKTTAIRCAAEAYTAAGYEVIGTATSGQAARTLGREADLAQSRTVASLLWRLDHGTLEFTPRHVVVLDEAGMTDDGDMLRLLTACDLAKAKVILVGDHRQLGPVGPGGALRALLNRHHGIVHVLSENIRQDNPTEREALRQLRGGKIVEAVAWYAENDRIRIAPEADEALRATVDAWYADVCAGRDAAMYAWRRTNVDALNRLARDRFALDGRLTGPELAAPGGRHYAIGDRIVTLAPAADGQVVTSERGEVVSADVHRRSLVARMDDGRFERLEGNELAEDRLAHGYATTVHRAQASTVDVAHRYEDGGGRELAYVSMSRGRERNTVHVVADNLDQAVEDLTRDWAVDHRARWAIDSGTPATEPLAVERHDGAPAGMRAALHHARLEAERRAVAAAIPPDRSADLADVRREIADLHQAQTELLTGHGRYAGTPEGGAARHLIDARHRHEDAKRNAETSDSWRDRRHWRKEATYWAEEEAAAEAAYIETVVPEMNRLDQAIRNLGGRYDELKADCQDRNAWIAQHPEVARRLQRLDRELNPLPELPEIEALGQTYAARIRRYIGIQPPGHDHGIEIDLGP